MDQMFKLLIVDDNAEVLSTLNNFFKKRNYDVLTATNGLDAKIMFEEEPQTFDLIITDLVMPKISGPGLITIVKKARPSLPVIAITGFGEHPEGLATEADADLVLEKPIDFFELDKLVGGLIAKHKKGAKRCK